MSEPYDPRNLLDGISTASTLEVHYAQEKARERELLRRRLPLDGGDVLAVGCGWDPGRHLFPRPAFRITGVELDESVVRTLVETGELDEGIAARAGELPFAPASFDIVLYRLVLHHVVFQGPLAPIFAEAARLLRPGGALVAMEPGRWHPVGAGLELANRVGLGPLVHGTPDDVPLSPRTLVREARAAGLTPELHAITYGWRRLPPAAQRLLHRLDAGGSRPRAAHFGHTLLLIARR
jgi:SAM-dependent methyltransferase